MSKEINKKTGEELQQFLAWRRKASAVPSKKGKGSYKRADFKRGIQSPFKEEKEGDKNNG